MKKIAASLLAACLLSACSGNAGNTQEGTSEATTLDLPTTTAATTSTTPTGPVINERGNIVKQFGEIAGLTDANGDSQATFAVDAVEVDAPCTSGYASSPENGHFLIISMRVTTGALIGLDFFHIVADDWQVIGADGITETNVATGPAYGCLADSERLTDSPMGPGQQFVGKLVLDSRNTSGSAIFAPPYLSDGGGWEWIF